MSKICFIADIHAHNFGEFGFTRVWNGKPINSRLYDLIQTLRRIVKAADKRGCTNLVVLGDVFHLRGQIPTDVMQYVYEFFQWAHCEMNMEIIIMTGNHDQADKAGQIHSIYALQGVAQIVDSAEMVQVDDTHLWMIPYTNSHEDLLHSLQRIDMDPDDENPNILCLHAGIDGSEVGTMEYMIKDPVTVEDLDAGRFDQVLLGHYHKPQTLASNVRYVGSPVQHSRSEMGDIKRWIMWDEGKIRSIKTGGKEFFTVNSSELADCDFIDGYYDVVIDNGMSPEEVKEAFKDHPGCWIKIISIKRQGAKKARIKVDATTTDGVLLKKYIKHVLAKDVDTDPTELKDLGLSLLNRATSSQTAKTSLVFNRLSVKNFMSIDHVELNLMRPGEVIAVIGENDDASGFESNGAGKSALLPESIYWCLFGKVARDLPADAVVNNRAKRDCWVELSMWCDGVLISVERYRKHSELGTGMSLFIGTQDVSQGKVADTEKMLWQMLGLDYTTFSSVMAFSPANLDFVSSSDAAQKQVLDSILQTSRFSAALDLAKQDAKDLKTSTQEITEALRGAEGKAGTLRDNLAEYRTNSDLFDQREEKRKKDLQAAIDLEQESLAEFKEEFAEASKTADELAKQVKDFVIPNVDEARAQQTTLNKSLGGLQADMRQLKKDATNNQVELDNVTSQAGKPCPKCGQPVMNTSKLMAILSTTRSTLADREVKLQAKIDSVKEQLAALENTVAAVDIKGEQFRALSGKLQTAEKAKNSIQTRMAAKKATIQNLKANMETVLVNEYETKLIPAAKLKLRDVKTKIKEATKLLETHQHNLALVNFWVTGFGNAGVKSFLFDQIVPELTEYANYYVEKLAGDSLSIEFSTHNEGGAFKDKFSIKAYNTEGSDLYGGNSSGERRRIDLCVMLALFRVANNRVAMSLLLMDEVFDTLDGVGIENVVGVMEELARDLDLTIFVTSHTNLSNMLHERITIRKKDGLANLMEN